MAVLLAVNISDTKFELKSSSLIIKMFLDVFILESLAGQLTHLIKG